MDLSITDRNLINFNFLCIRNVLYVFVKKKKKKCYLVFRVKETRRTSKEKKIEILYSFFEAPVQLLKIEFMEKGDEKSDFSEYE